MQICSKIYHKFLCEQEKFQRFIIGLYPCQFDTLPVALSGPEEMRPGHLVFVSGTYFNEQKKQQRHGMVHVEIWLGDGEKTVGARWQKGR